MKTKMFAVSVLGVTALSMQFAGVAGAQSCVYPDDCTKTVAQPDDDDAKVAGQVVTGTQADGLGVAQGALALTGGDAVGLSVVGAGLLGAGGLIVLGTRRKAEADT